MSTAELARLCAVQLVQRLSDTPRLTDEERIALVESYVAGALNRALSEAGRAPTFVVQSGHVSLDLNLNAKGELQYGAKLMLPIDGLETERVTQVREQHVARRVFVDGDPEAL